MENSRLRRHLLEKRDRTILGRISKRGNRYLRMLFMQGARVILLRPENWQKHSGAWLTAAAKRLHHNVRAHRVRRRLGSGKSFYV
jgi:transposase